MSSSSGNLTKKALSGGVRSLLSKVGGLVLSIGFMAVLSRLLGPKDYGSFAFMTLIVGVVTIVPSAFAQVLMAKEESPELVARSHLSGLLVFGLICSAVAVLTWSALADANLLGTAIGWQLQWCVALVTLLSCVTTVLEGILGRLHQFGCVSLSDFLSQAVVANVATLLFAWCWPDLRSLLYGAALAALVRLLVQVHGAIKAGVRVTGGQAPVQTGTSFLSFSFVQLANYLGRNADNWVVGSCVNASELGVYSRAYNLMSKPMLALSGFVLAVFYPLMIAAKADDQKFRNGYLKATVVVSLVGLSSSGFLVTMAQDIVNLVLGPKWDSVAPAFAALSFGAYFRIAYRVTESVGFVRGSGKSNVLRQSLYAGVVLLAAFAGAKYGAFGVAVGVSMALALFFMVSLSFANRLAKVQLGAWAQAVAPSLVITILASLLTWQLGVHLRVESLAKMFIRGAAYWGAIVLLWGLMLWRLRRHVASATLLGLSSRSRGMS